MIAVGLSVIMGLMRVINLAHGGFALLGGAFAHWLTVDAVFPSCAAFLAIVATMAIALPLEVVLYSRIYRMGDLQQVLATIGIAFIMIAGVNLCLVRRCCQSACPIG